MIHEEIERLPARYRDVVVLHHLEGLPQDRIARQLRRPVGTIQSRLHRTRSLLRDRMERRGFAPTLAVPLFGPFPEPLVGATATLAVRVIGASFSGTVPAGVASLVLCLSWGESMIKLGLAGACVAVSTSTLMLAAHGIRAEEGRGESPLPAETISAVSATSMTDNLRAPDQTTDAVSSFRTEV